MEFKVKFDIGNRRRASLMVRNARDKAHAYKVAFKEISKKHPSPVPVCISIEEIKDTAEQLANIMGFSFKKK